MNFRYTREPMSDIQTIVESALNASDVDYSHLSEFYDEKPIKEYLDVILNGIEKSWAPLKATVVSIVAKLRYPEWDTRNHQTQIGGAYSLRTIDRCHVSNILYKKGLYDTATEFALTRSFEKAEPFTKSYTGNISPKECKSAFLNLVEFINVTRPSNSVLRCMLMYLLGFLTKRNEKLQSMKHTLPLSSKQLELLDVSTVCEFISNLGAGSSVVPVITVHTLLQVIQPLLFEHASLNPLKEHTAPDNHSHSYGDVECTHKDYDMLIAIEVKHKIAVTETIVLTFDAKTKSANIPMKYIITTANVPRKVFANNICADTLKNFVVSYIQQALVYDTMICAKFLQSLDYAILNHTNISLTIKEQVKEYFTKVLASPSP